ncbi:MAG: hypothetical protein ACM3JC_03130 [Rudaea sp.]
MPEASDQPGIVLLGWRANGDGFDVALAVHRALASGARAWWMQGAGGPADAGDYLLELSAPQRAALARLGLAIGAWRGDVPADARQLARPAVRLFAGRASQFPYFAYYALCLLRLGIDYVPCDGSALAHGALDDANLLILPGGFATWGIDAAEDAPGADARVRDFLARGGAAIGSCGGAFYLSAGRPAWTGAAQAKPLYTHEYLQSGVGIVSVALAEGPLAFGCPPTMEVPYYHGPIYDALGSGVDVAATFSALALPGRLSIDNPLDRERFERDMAGKPAILVTEGRRGRAVLFSPHPEMGDLIRKYIALDGYVRHYLPIRGAETMRDTLRHYRGADAPSFRLVSNAVDMLLSGYRSAHGVASDEPRARPSGSDDRPRRDRSSTDEIALAAFARRTLAALRDLGAGGEADLLRDLASRLSQRIAPAADHAAAVMMESAGDDDLLPAWRHLASAVGARDVSQATVAQRLMEAELAISLLECWTRVAIWNRALAEAR